MLAYIAGILFSLLWGVKLNKFWRFPGFKIKPLISKFEVPALVPQIIIGMIARNLFGDFMEAYPEKWAIFIRKCILSLILTRGGMNVTFKGKGILVVLLVVVPQTIEVFVNGFLAEGFFGMPMAFGFCLSYAIGTIAAAVLVPGMLSLNDRKYGTDKGISGTLIASCTFENILCLIMFGIVNSVALN